MPELLVVMLAPSSKRLVQGIALIMLAACGGSTTAPPQEDPVPTTLTLSLSSVQLSFINQTRAVTATVRDQDGNPMAGAVTWTSNDGAVADVTAAGVIRAVANGSTTVTATAGTLMEEVAVEVAQVATFLGIVSGDNQSALAGTQVPNPLVAKVQDQGGTGVQGLEVTFTPDAGSGTVDPTSATSAADGTVSTTWTLGAQFGPQRVVAAFGSAQAEFDAFAGSDTPTPDLMMPTSVTVLRADPSSLDTVTVRTTVRNQGDADALAFRVQLLVDDVEVGTTDITVLGAGAEQQVDFEVSALAAGTRQLKVVVDADDTVLELNEANNVNERPLVVLLQQTIAPNSSIGALSANVGQTLYFRLQVPGPTNLTVDLAGGSGDVDLWIEGGRRPNLQSQYDDCISDGPAMTETCQIVNADGEYHIAVHAPQNPPGTPQGFTNSTLTVTLGAAVQPFNLELVFIDNGTASQDQAFLDAAGVWNSIIIGDIPDIDLGAQGTPANACIDGQPSVSGVVDDVKIFVAIRAIDGPLGVLARAGPCFIRVGSGLTIVGHMEFDSADLDRLELDGDMEEVVLHEMGHVLGIGTIWSRRNLLQAPSTSSGQNGCTVSSPNADTHFTGELAREAFNAAGGGTYPNAKVPVANGEFGAGCGSADGHWRESVMDTEMMTPFIDGLVANPLSAITVQSLADLGYSVDVSQAEAYTLPSPATMSGAAAPAPGGARLIDLSDDLYRGPVWVYDEGGRVVTILR